MLNPTIHPERMTDGSQGLSEERAIPLINRLTHNDPGGIAEGRMSQLGNAQTVLIQRQFLSEIRNTIRVLCAIRLNDYP